MQCRAKRIVSMESHSPASAFVIDAIVNSGAVKRAIDGRETGAGEILYHSRTQEEVTREIGRLQREWATRMGTPFPLASELLAHHQIHFASTLPGRHDPKAMTPITHLIETGVLLSDEKTGHLLGLGAPPKKKN